MIDKLGVDLKVDYQIVKRDDQGKPLQSVQMGDSFGDMRLVTNYHDGLVETFFLLPGETLQ